MKRTIREAVFPLCVSALLSLSANANEYGIPAEIQQGNILHCFNWKPSEIKAELKSIAEAGYGAVQLSPLQRPDITSNSKWHDLYRPFDLAFKSSDFCSEQDLKDLCSEASKYGIKVIVDVVANHIDKTPGYHDEWWDVAGRVRWYGNIDYGSRYSITHSQLGDYGDINSEDSEVAARAKAYVVKLKELGVKGIRWDAAKHIALPSEGCSFWSAVTSVDGMYHYGEILDSPGPESDNLIKEYVKYMSVTDNRYSDGSGKNNGGIPFCYAGDWVVTQECPDNKMVYWGESHDTYSNNDGWSKYRDQSLIDRAYASVACRNGATALYLARPYAQDFNSIKAGKNGGDSYKSKQISEVNKFRNVMTGRADWFENSGEACSITRKDGGAVIVAKGEGYVSVKNGGGYCPPGKYKDRISGNEFTVTESSIIGRVDEYGIAVIYADDIEPLPDPDPNPTPDPDPVPDPDPNPDPQPTPDPDPDDGVYIYFNNIDEDGDIWGTTLYVWAWNGEVNCNEANDYPGDKMYPVAGLANIYRWDLPEGKPEPANLIISNQKKAKAGNADLKFLNHRTYFSTGEAKTIIYGNQEPIPVEIPSQLYVIGNLEGAQWNTSDDRGEMYLEQPGVFRTKSKLTFTPDSGQQDCYFSLSDNLGSDWDDLNSKANRFGPNTKDEPLSLNEAGVICKFANNVNASSCNSWKIPAGSYYIEADFNKGIVKLTDTTSTDFVSSGIAEEPVYFTLQGLKVDCPKSGIFIKVTGSKAAKVVLK